jgi:hypothetical protein
VWFNSIRQGWKYGLVVSNIFLVYLVVLRAWPMCGLFVAALYYKKKFKVSSRPKILYLKKSHPVLYRSLSFSHSPEHWSKYNCWSNRHSCSDLVCWSITKSLKYFSRSINDSVTVYLQVNTL